MLERLTDARAVHRAIDEFDELGRDGFLRKYGFGASTRYFVLRNGRRYDSKAIAGVAYGFEHPDEGPLRSDMFSGGDATVRMALERLGFEMDSGALATEATNLRSLLDQVGELVRKREAGDPSFSQADLVALVRDLGPTILERPVAMRGDVRGRAGFGSPADVPWMGVFPPGNEGSAQDGFYLVYLFAKDGSRVYLSLNQGTEQVTGGKEVLLKRAIDLRRAAGEQPDLNKTIDLRSTNERPRKYEAGNAYAIEYKLDDLPDEDRLRIDLDRMLAIMLAVNETGLTWDSRSEPLHLVFKWSAEIEPRTIELHRSVASQEGSVWWGRFSSSTTPTIAASKLRSLQDQIAKGVPTHAYLYRRGQLWRTVVREIQTTPPEPGDRRFPAYYSVGDCNLFVRVSDFEELDPQWLIYGAVVASDPDEDPQRLASALGNQTSPLYIFEMGGVPRGLSLPTPPPAEPDIDLATVTLEDVCRDIAEKVRLSGLDYGARHDDFIRSAVVSLATKRFLLLTGLSGSGKTRLAIGIGEWFGADRLKVIAVRPDWSGPDALLGYEDALRPAVNGRAVWRTPDALEFMMRAAADPDHPYMLVLDEMNLAHVERYFADVLSGIESKQPVLPNVQRSGGSWVLEDVPLVTLPENLFIAGTVNIDETTYMFSPKVLDRANTLEFRVGTDDLQAAASAPQAVSPGSDQHIRRFLLDSTSVDDSDWEERALMAEHLRSVHGVLAAHGREFGHRVFLESLRFGALLASGGVTDVRAALDLQVLQKILPRFHGSIRELAEPMSALGAWCFGGPGSAIEAFDPLNPPPGSPYLPLSFDKLQRMTRRLRANHFVGFAE